MLREHIKEWILKISLPQDNLGGMAICPYAKSAQFDLVESDGLDLSPPPWHFEIIIYKLPDSFTEQQLFDLAKKANFDFDDTIYLPDHKDRNTFINGVQTNNGKYNLILCQPKEKLKTARYKLMKTNYYSFWDKDYLNEILGEDVGRLD
jgi:hypothetical protein